MPFSTTAKNQMLDAGLATVHVSLHTSDPGDLHTQALASEVSGGSPSYARVAMSLAAAASGSKAQTGTAPVFNVPSGRTITHVGYWKVAASGGATDYLGSAALQSAETFNAQGTYTILSGLFSLT